MINTVLNTVNKYKMLNNNDKVVLGLSGGSDSVALLYILIKLKKIYNIKILCVHINHNIRKEESLRDEVFVKNLCKNLNIDIKIFSEDIIKISKNLKISEEETGRIIRYKYFNKVLKENKFNKIAVAHNLDDSIETMMMRLFRGSGLKGICGILPVRDNIIRPFIDCRKEDIENFCKINKINYVVDTSNRYEKYTRNKIRLNLIPYIKREFNKNILYTLKNTLEILREEEDYLNKKANIFYNKYVYITEDNIQKLNLDILKIDIIIVKRVIRLCCLNYYKNLYNVSLHHINSIIDLCNNTSGKTIKLPLNLKIEKCYNNIIFYEEKTTKKFEYNINFGDFFYVEEMKKYISFNKKEILEKSGYINICTKVFSYDKIKNSIILRNRKSGDKIYIKNINGTKKIKEYFIDKKIERYKRDIIPLLADGNNIIWIIDKLNTVNDIYKKQNENNFYVQLWEETKNV